MLGDVFGLGANSGAEPARLVMIKMSEETRVSVQSPNFTVVLPSLVLVGFVDGNLHMQPGPPHEQQP